MSNILSRLVQEKQPSQILKKLMLMTDVFSGSQVLDRLRGFFPLLQGKHSYSVKSKCKQYKIHTFRNLRNCATFALKASKEDPLKWYMTAFGIDIKKGDFIVIKDKIPSITFSVEHIDYYLDPPDLWMASLIECRDWRSPSGIVN